MDVSMIPIFIMVSTMIELSSKFKNIIFWALTASISLIVFGIFVIDIFVIDAHGKDKLSIIFSYLSTIFAFLSALALFATIGVYFWQRNDDLKKQSEFDERIIPEISRIIRFMHDDTRQIISIFKEIKNYNISIDLDILKYSRKNFDHLYQSNKFLAKPTISLNKINESKLINDNIMNVSFSLYKIIKESIECESRLRSIIYSYTTLSYIRSEVNSLYPDINKKMDEEDINKTQHDLNELELKISRLKSLI
ncbi:hypothetical protein [Proteus vulgaris]|uniref:hypothetical protein n=1 Tax=Proteus vulgaris TaxID=585 RepID=UPI000659779E|nr:hypothetical protein [Proteus vulgaris]CRL60119.1 hypothetical protein BN1805_00569 [Proteus vulgaris]